MLSDFFEWLRYDHPTAFRGLISFLVMLCMLVVFIAIPPSPLMNALGVVSGQKKLSSLYYAAFWSIRAYTNNDAGMPALHTTYGNMLGLDPSGKLVISVPSGSKFIQSKVQIADTKLTDLFGAASLIGQLRTEDAKFVIYPENQAVVWIREVPFNVKLIEAGYAIPDPNPPTNIVDKAFATYYWRNFKGAENDQKAN